MQRHKNICLVLNLKRIESNRIQVSDRHNHQQISTSQRQTTTFLYHNVCFRDLLLQSDSVLYH
jgi:hypothetical protein